MAGEVRDRDLLRSQDTAQLESNLLLELSLQHGAHFEGKRIGELELPSGCLIITVERGLHSHVAIQDRIRFLRRVTASPP